VSDSAAWEREEGVTCVVCPACAFTFDAFHTDADGGYSCPVCEIERLRDRAVCSGCGNDVGESGACSYSGCDDGEMIPASELPLALREMRDRRDEWRQEAMSL
jgi:hypothetical protein